MGLTHDSTCSKCEDAEETSIYVLCHCEGLSALRFKCSESAFFDIEVKEHRYIQFVSCSLRYYSGRPSRIRVPDGGHHRNSQNNDPTLG